MYSLLANLYRVKMMRKIISASILAIIIVCMIVPLTTALSNYNYYTRVTFSNTTASTITGRFVVSMNAAGLISQGFMQADADDVRVGTESNISYNSLTDATGTFTGSPIKLKVGANTVACTVAGSATILLPDGYTGTAATGTMTVDSNPVSLVAGVNTITTSGGIGNITVTIVYVSYEGSTIGELANSASYWYTDYITVPAYGSVSKDFWTGNGAALPRDQWWISDDADVNTVADDPSLDIDVNAPGESLTLSAQVNLSALPATEKEIISKEGNYELAVDNTNFIFRVWKGAGAATETLSPTSTDAGMQLYNPVSGMPALSNFTYINEAAPLGAGGDASYLYINYVVGSGIDWMGMANSTIPEGSNITSVTVYFRANKNAGTDGIVMPSLKLGADIQNGVNQSVPTGGPYNYNQVIARPGGGGWSKSDIDNLKVGLFIGGVSDNICLVTQMYISVAYTAIDAGHVSQIAAGTGQKNIACTYDGAHTSITDGTLTDTDALAGALFTNAEPLDIARVDGKVDDLKIGDTSIAAPTWKLDLTFEASDIAGTGAATTVADHSGLANNMTSTRAGNPGGITVTIAGMLPSTPSTVPILGTESLVNDATKEWNPQDYTIPEAGSTLTNAQIPGILADTASRVSGVQVNWIWYFAYGIICISLFLVGMRFLGGHITLSWIMVIIATACFVSWSVVPWWFVMIYSIFALGSLAWENRTTI
jgi:hypothetical protein